MIACYIFIHVQLLLLLSQSFFNIVNFYFKNLASLFYVLYPRFFLVYYTISVVDHLSMFYNNIECGGTPLVHIPIILL